MWYITLASLRDQSGTSLTFSMLQINFFSHDVIMVKKLPLIEVKPLVSIWPYEETEAVNQVNLMKNFSTY